MVTRQWLWLPWNKKYSELGRKEINIARIRLISSIFAKDFIEESKDEIGRISFHLPKINDHTRSIKRKLVLVLSCSESGSKVNDTWIERTSDNAWRSAGKVEKERKKKKKIEIVVGRTIARTLDWMDFWWNFRAILSSWMMLACLYLYSMLHCFRKYLFSPRCRDSSRTIRTPLCFAQTQRKQLCLKTEAARRRNNNKRFSFTSYLLFLPFQEQFDKRFLRNSMETTALLLI